MKNMKKTLFVSFCLMMTAVLSFGLVFRAHVNQAKAAMPYTAAFSWETNIRNATDDGPTNKYMYKPEGTVNAFAGVFLDRGPRSTLLTGSFDIWPTAFTTRSRSLGLSSLGIPRGQASSWPSCLRKLSSGSGVRLTWTFARCSLQAVDSWTVVEPVTALAITITRGTANASMKYIV